LTIGLDVFPTHVPAGLGDFEFGAGTTLVLAEAGLDVMPSLIVVGLDVYPLIGAGLDDVQ
jgi:hypothetical protein